MGGLMPSSQGALVVIKDGQITVTDGPYAEAKELVGGWIIVDFPSKAAAIAQAKKFVEVHRQILGPDYEGYSEVRQVFEAPPGM